jgi:uncharacterized lipoprotein NlpE involved in copper resistance
MKAVKFLMALTIILALFGCNNPKDKLVGKWQGTGTSMEFLKDGTLVNADSGGGKWSILEDGRFKIEFASGGAIVTKITFNGSDEMTMVVDEPGKAAKADESDKYKRIK